MFRRYLAVFCFAALAFGGCARMYSLPDAPPKSEWVKAQKAQESPEDAAKRYLDAKRGAIQCFAALADGNWTQALSRMTADSVAYLREHAAGGDIEASLNDKTLMFGGKAVPFDPVNDVFIADLTDIRDEFGGINDGEEDETTKILYAVSRSGEARRIAVVLEDNLWKVKFTDISNDALTP